MKNQRVLIVEDEIDSRELLVLGLQELGYHCNGVADGHEFLNALNDGWNVCIIDIVLPGPNGIELLSAVRATGMNCAVIIISSFANKNTAISALNKGADYLLEKPFSVHDLHTLIQKLTPITRKVTLADRVHRYKQLTDRERELTLYVLKGLPNTDIARLAGISLQGVKNALGRIYTKLDIVNRRELFSIFIDE